jgi:hypothetical protein
LADQALIDKVKANLPSWAEELASWDDTKVGEMLDTNNSNVPGTVRLFWLQRVSDLAAISDVTDASSTRPLSQTYQHAQEMLKYWDRIGGVDASSVVNIKRRYRRRHGGYGLSDYGGVYARTD